MTILDTSCTIPYTEWILLGAIGWRLPNQRLLWDSENLRFTNSKKANDFIKPDFRKGRERKDNEA